MVVFVRVLTLFLCLGLVACAPRGSIAVDTEAASVGKSYPVFYSTSRRADPVRQFGSRRSQNVAFGRLDVSVPPEHKTGAIEISGSNPDPLRHFIATQDTKFFGADDFSVALRKELRSRPFSERLVVVYVHGFNNNFAEGIYRLAQISHDFNLPEVTVHYSWPSAGHPLGYGYDRDSVLFARDGLEELLHAVQNAGADKILLMGHSLGALLAMETLRQMAISDSSVLRRTLGGVVLISPDIDVEVFHQQAIRIGKLPQPFVIFASEKDRALRLSARLTGQPNRLGTLTDASAISDLDVTVFDVTNFSTGIDGHFTAASSPALIRILSLLPTIESSFRNDRAGRLDLLQGTVLTVQNATQVVLSPL